MSTFLKADIFFFVSSVGVVVATTAITVAAIYVAKTAYEARALVRSVRKEIETIRSERRTMIRRAHLLSRFIARFVHHMRNSRQRGNRQY